MNNIEGQIIIKLFPQNKHERVEISSTRPLHASRILIGKTPDQALAMIPLIFNVCSIAQAHAARLAIEQKLDRDGDYAQETARNILVLAETAKEYLLLIFLDWPRLFQIDNKNPKISYLGQMVKDFSVALFKQGKPFSLNSQLNEQAEEVLHLINRLDEFLVETLFQTPLENWLGYENASMYHWAKETDTLAAQTVNFLYEYNWVSQGYTECAGLPELDEAALLKIFNSDSVEQFISQPQWQGQCFETTALIRQFYHPIIQDLYGEYSAGLITRWVARLIDLANIPQQMRALFKQLNAQVKSPINTQLAHDLGISQVEAARGRLVHRVEIEQGRICQYQILAPTEWNFHPRGVLVQSLQELDGKDRQELEQLAHLIINTFDPCVGYQLSVH